jgi:hypothetical protein
LDGGEICIPLYVDIRKLRDLIPDPDPDPRVKVFEDLRTLAIVFSIAKILNAYVSPETGLVDFGDDDNLRLLSARSADSRVGFFRALS